MTILFVLVLTVTVVILQNLTSEKPESGQQAQMQIMNVNEIFGEIAPGNSNEEIFMRILVAIGIIAAVVITVMVFRALARRDKLEADDSGVKDERSAAALRPGRKSHVPENTYVEKVRQQMINWPVN